MRNFANDKVRHLPSKKRIAVIMLLLMVCGGVITGQA